MAYYGGECTAFLSNGRVAWQIPSHCADRYLRRDYLPPDGWMVSGRVEGVEHPLFGYIVINAVAKRKTSKGWAFSLKRREHGHQ